MRRVVLSRGQRRPAPVQVVLSTVEDYNNLPWTNVQEDDTIAAMSKMRSDVLLSCSVAPLSVVDTCSASPAVCVASASTGPTGQNVSKLLPRIHWPPPPR